MGWLAVGTLLIAAAAHVFTDTRYLIGNFEGWHWVLLIAVVALSAAHTTLNRIRVAIESISSVTCRIAWILAWLVFGLQFFNVVTRYTTEYVEADILFGEVVSMAWQSFALLFLLGINAGVRDGVNPRIDFWWTRFSDRTKAGLDFVIHAVLLLPFTVMSIRILQGYVSSSLGRKYSGEWPSGWRVWETWEEAVDAGGLPVGPIKAMLLIGFILFALQVIAELIKTGFVLIGREDYGKITTAGEAPQRIE